MKLLLLLAFVSCAKVRTQKIDLRTNTVTVCGNGYAQQPDLVAEAALSCRASRPVLASCEQAPHHGSCCEYVCQ